MKVVIRPATAADLTDAYDVQQEASAAEGLEIGNVGPSPAGRVPAKFRHELAHGRFLVAEGEGRIQGFGAVFERGGVAFLATFYVRPNAQQAGRGIGQRLLDRLFDGPASMRCVVSSHVHRALALYARNGILPRWPLYMMAGERNGIRPDTPGAVEAVDAQPGDRALLELDKRIAGRGNREIDQRYWLETHRARPYWLHREGRRIGYGYIQDLGHSEDAPWNPDSAFVGPVGVLEPADAAGAVIALVEQARSTAGVVLLDVPGSHPALPALLHSGFRIHYQATFCCSEGSGPFDPACYLPADTITF